MSELSIGYIGVKHHHRDPYFDIASKLPVRISAVCEPSEAISRDDLVPLRDRPDEITGVDRDVADVAEDATIYEDPETLLDSEAVDVVWITYSNDCTPAIVEAAVEEGVHVLSEKPIARTAEELSPLAEKADNAGVEITPTYFYRANPIVADIQSYVKDGFFGDIWSIEGRFIGSQLQYRDTTHYIYDRKRSRGGVLQWIGLHWIDMMTYALDDPITRVNAATYPAEEADIEAGATLQFTTEGGTMGTFQSGYYLDGRGKDTHFGVYGTDAQARSPVHHDALAVDSTAPLEITSKEGGWETAPRRITNYQFAYERFEAWGDYVLAFFEQFFNGILDGTVPADVDDAVAVLRVLDAAYESAETGSWIEV